MKTILLLVSLSLLAVSCDAPQRTRLTNLSKSTINTPNGNSNAVNVGNDTKTEPAPTTVAGFENCKFDSTATKSGIGSYSFCQNASDESFIMVKSVTVTLTEMLCFIPTLKSADGSSTYLSNQPQCASVQAGKTISGYIRKNRTGYESASINGVIAIKRSLLAAYYNCMDAYYAYVSAACPYGYQTNATCATYAANYRTSICNTFKTSYYNDYIDLRLK